MIEIWKEIFGGYYKISNLGRVKRAVAGQGARLGKILKIQPGKPYPTVWLQKEGRGRPYYLHIYIY